MEMIDGVVLEHMNTLLVVFKEANDTMPIGTSVECEGHLTSVDAGCVVRQRPGRGDPPPPSWRIELRRRAHFSLLEKKKWLCWETARKVKEGRHSADRRAVMARLWT
jgi:hypothetical protein